MEENGMNPPTTAYMPADVQAILQADLQALSDFYRRKAANPPRSGEERLVYCESECALLQVILDSGALTDDQRNEYKQRLQRAIGRLEQAEVQTALERERAAERERALLRVPVFGILSF